MTMTVRPEEGPSGQMHDHLRVLHSHGKGVVELVADDERRYVFSDIIQVASRMHRLGPRCHRQAGGPFSRLAQREPRRGHRLARELAISMGDGASKVLVKTENPPTSDNRDRPKPVQMADQSVLHSRSSRG